MPTQSWDASVVGSVIALAALLGAVIAVVAGFLRVKLAKLAKPAESTKPTEPTEPTESAKLAESTKPAEFGKQHDVSQWLRCRLDQEMGSAQWDFSNSWASMLTSIGGVLGVALAAQLGKPAYNGLNVLFLLLVFLAPLVYKVMGRQEWRLPLDTQLYTSDIARLIEPGRLPKPPMTMQFQGTVKGFLAACTLTLWAVIGEVATLVVLLGYPTPTSSADYVSWPVLILQVGALILGIPLLIYYAVQTVPWTIEAQISQQAVRREAHRRTVHALSRVETLGEFDRNAGRERQAQDDFEKVAEAPVPLPPWSLL